MERPLLLPKEESKSSSRWLAWLFGSWKRDAAPQDRPRPVRGWKPSSTKDLQAWRNSQPSGFSTTFPPLIFWPGWRWMIMLAAFPVIFAGFVCWISPRWSSSGNLDSMDIVKYTSIPVVNVLFTYFHIWAALYMTFYPLRYLGCLQIPNTNAGLGWQGIVPSRAEQMARTSVELMTTKLLTMREIFERLDPNLIAKELDPLLHSVLSHIMEEVAMQQEPRLWSSLPSKVKLELIVHARESVPPVIKALLFDVTTRIEEVFDLSDMVVKNLIREPELMNHMFITCGYKELEFIRNCGGWMGALFGFVQVVLWVIWSEGWMLPSFGFVVGLITNCIALKMIFEPVEPRSILGGRIVLHGLFLRRQKEVSREYARIVANNVLSSRNLIPATVTGPCADRLFDLVHAHVHEAVDRFTGVTRPLIKMFRGADDYIRCRDLVCERIMDTMPRTVLRLEKVLDDAMDLENILSARMSALPSSDYERLLHPVFQQDEWKLILMGGVLGVLVGFGQWWALGT